MKPLRATEVSGSRRGCLYLLLTLVIILIPSSPSKFSPATNCYYSRTILAEASYLEDVGRLSEAMNQFVDALLEKVSFLAEIIIQSSMEEQCLTTSDRELKCQQASKSSKKASLLDTNENISDHFDSLEFTNVNQFVDSLNTKKRNKLNSAQQQQQQAESSCKLFSFAVNQQDLPVKRMELCCSKFQGCYTECGQKKLDCDLQFQQCLKSMCKQHFDYTNETLLRDMHSILRREASLNEPLALDDDDLLDDDSDADANDSYHLHQTGGCCGKRKGIFDPGEEKSATIKGVDSGRQASPETTTTTGSSKDKPQAFEVSSREVKRLKDKYKACKLAIKVLIIGNLAFGCQTYKQSQWSACCGGEEEEGKRVVSDKLAEAEELVTRRESDGSSERIGNVGKRVNLEAGGKVDIASFTALNSLPGAEQQQTTGESSTTTTTTTTTGGIVIPS